MHYLLALLLLAAPDTFTSLSKRAQAAHQANRPAEAIALYRRALKLNPKWAPGWWGLGALEYADKRYQGCRDALLNLTALDPKARAGWALLGLCEFELKNYDAAGAHLERARAGGQGKGTLAFNTELHYALLTIRDGAFELGLAVLEPLAKQAPDNSSVVAACGLGSLRMAKLPSAVPEESREMVTLAGQAFVHAARQEPDQAETVFKALLEKYSGKPNVAFFYGTWLGMDRRDEARAMYLRELDLNSKHAAALVRLALIALEDGKTEEAVGYARRAGEADPQFGPALVTLGRSLLQSDRPAEALQPLLRARGLAPESAQIRLLLVRAYRELGQEDKAELEQAEFNRLKK